MATVTELQIPKSKAVALFVAMGFKTAKKWSCEKLTDKINQIDTEPDEPFEDEELDGLMDDLLDAEEAVVVPDEEDEEVEEQEEVTKEVDEDEDVEEEKPKKKGKGKKAGKKAAKEKAPKEKKEKKAGRKRENSIDAVTLALIQSKPMTLETILKNLEKQFPDNDPETLKRTTKRRLTGYLQNKYGVTIEKSDKGAYSVK
jgi:outer membrane biosynthesis protein TonB